MKLWHAGCRVFFGVGDSLFYHFAKVSTARIRKNDGRRQFLMKWGVTQSAFDRYWLRRGQAVPQGGHGMVLPEPERSWRSRLAQVSGAVQRRLR
jgi:hypothetical protein